MTVSMLIVAKLKLRRITVDKLVLHGADVKELGQPRPYCVLASIELQ